MTKTQIKLSRLRGSLRHKGSVLLMLVLTQVVMKGQLSCR